ncbi:hypothetical protein [Hyphobacterium marinum]|uniref:Yip1 domain-containing protein n=1 Tax=Hyphobacterium marinum TaxID=3116574 RepID=A0ABU7LUN8_9PROT|nr:hypothetical protein [Hyphobacterium sp. Y6023]MEE2565273.1 hypothetical protein [Hyphobacterium sp. Y6023]
MTNKVAIDDLAEDVFGLNIRGIRSIATIWIHPRRYFQSARSPDWDNRYTPSIRLWLSLIALASLLQFLWIGTDTPLVSAYAAGFEDAGVTPSPGMTFQELGERAALWIYAFAPAVQFVLFLAVLGFFPFWGERTSYSLRLRNLFAIMMPSATAMTLLLPAMALIPVSLLTAFGYLIGLLTLLLDTVTGFRGAFPAVDGLARLWRAGLLAVAILTLNVIANISAQIAGIVFVSVVYA